MVDRGLQVVKLFSDPGEVTLHRVKVGCGHRGQVSVDLVKESLFVSSINNKSLRSNRVAIIVGRSGDKPVKVTFSVLRFQTIYSYCQAWRLV